MKKLLYTVIAILGFANLTMAQVPSYVPTNGLVGYWPFNGNTNDASGNGNNGTNNFASLSPDRYGNINSAYNFNNSNITLPFTNLNFANNFTISIWVNIDTFSAAYPTFLVGQNDYLKLQFAQGVPTSKASFYFANGLGSGLTDGNVIGGNILTKTWINIVIKDSSKIVKLYINGNLISMSTNPSNYQGNTVGSSLKVGNGNTLPIESFIGKTDDIGIWNRALTQQEISNIYNSNTSLCKLINSATFTVPNATSINQLGGAPALSVSNNKSSFANLSNQNWQNIVITKDNSNIGKIYKNGQLIYSGNYLNLTYSWSKLILGASFYTSYSGWFKGWLDEIRVSNTVLTNSEILANYNSNAQLSSNTNTAGLWHFDQSSGTSITSSIGTAGTITNATWDVNGKFGSCLYFNGTNARAEILQSIPTANMSFEFWIKPEILQNSWPICWYGMNTEGFGLNIDTSVTNYTWSNGSIGNSITINPQGLPYVWVTNGTCYDTIFFNRYTSVSDSLSLVQLRSDSITKLGTINSLKSDTTTKGNTIRQLQNDLANKHDTLYVGSTITSDTLKISIHTGISTASPVINSLKVYPNPASTLLNIVLEKPGYYVAKLSSVTGQSIIAPTSGTIDISALANGVYILTIYDSNNKLISTNKVSIIK